MRVFVVLALLGSAARADRVAIASFELSGAASAELKRSLRASLAGALATAGLDVAPEAEVTRSRERGGISACDTMSCLHRLAELAGVKTVVKARVEVVGSNYTFTLERIDPVAERSIGRVDESCQVCTTAEANEALAGAGRKLASSPGSADEAKARTLDASAAAAYAAGRFEAAARDFEEAFALSKRTPLLWNIAQSYRRQWEIDRDPAKLRRARVVLRNLLGLQPQPDMRHDAEALAAEIDAELARPPVVAVKSEPAPPKPTPLYRRWQLWLGVGLGAAAVIAIGVGVGVGRSGGTDWWQAASSHCTNNCTVVDLRQ